MRFAILGAGRIGQVHADAVGSVRAATLSAISDPMEAAAQAVIDRHGGTAMSIDDIAASQEIDAVIICTPTDTHADLIEQFARAGKAIFCEKPIDLDIDRVKACLSVVDEAGATLMLGFQRRFDPDFNALKVQIDAGSIGTVETVTLTSRDPSPPPYAYIERSGGIFRDMTIHDFDVARWILGEEVETVQAVGSVLVDPKIGELGDYDTVHVLMTTASGKQATIMNTRRATYGYDQRIEVHGSMGAITANNHHMSTVTMASGEGYTQPPLQDFFMTRYANAYAAEIAHFVEALSAGTSPATTGKDGLMALVLAEAAVQSVREGRRINVADILG
ncbi:MAG: inositol 2-dehydrogenase [Pseudomonadota bacterium]